MPQIIRGPSGSEFFLHTDWYFDGEYTHSGLFYSDDHGQTIQVNYEYGYPGGPPSLGEVVDDAQPGVLYNKPYYYSDFLISYDYGISWNSIEINPSIGSYFSGKVPGEIFHSGFSNEGYLLKSIDYGQSFDTININVKYSFDVGINSEILYGVTIIFEDQNQYLLHISHDNGLTFNECLALDTLVTGRSIEDIYRGANSGELYLVSRWLPDHYKIFFSTDDGHTWQFRHRTNAIDFWSFSFTPGSESGIFYIARLNMDPTETHTWLYIDYSSDTARTFTTYFHDLTPDVGLAENEKESPTFSLKCFPNPATSIVDLRLLVLKAKPEGTIYDLRKDVILEMYDIFGRLIPINLLSSYLEEGGRQSWQIDVSSLTPGIYLAVVRDEKGMVGSAKFVVAR